METQDAVHALSGLANETRLSIFRWLIQTGPEGQAAGEIAERFDLPAPTLSFHLSSLTQCGLLQSRREGRRIVYTADFDQMNSLMAYLTENCCSGRSGSCDAPTSLSCSINTRIRQPEASQT